MVLALRRRFKSLAGNELLRLSANQPEPHHPLHRRHPQPGAAGANEHREGLGEGFSARYGLKKLVYFEAYGDALAAIAREKQIKSWNRKRKEKLIEGYEPRLAGFVGRDSAGLKNKREMDIALRYARARVLAMIYYYALQNMRWGLKFAHLAKCASKPAGGQGKVWKWKLLPRRGSPRLAMTDYFYDMRWPLVAGGWQGRELAGEWPTSIC